MILKSFEINEFNKTTGDLISEIRQNLFPVKDFLRYSIENPEYLNKDRKKEMMVYLKSIYNDLDELYNYLKLNKKDERNI